MLLAIQLPPNPEPQPVPTPEPQPVPAPEPQPLYEQIIKKVSK